MFLTPTITVFLKSTKNFTQSPVVSDSPKVLSTAALVQATNDGVKFHPSTKDSVNVTNLMHFMEFSIVTVGPVRLFS